MDDDLRRILGHEDAGYGRADEAPPAQDQDLLVLQVQEPASLPGARRRSRQIDEREKTRQLLAREPSRAAGREPASVRNAKRVRTSRSTRPPHASTIRRTSRFRPSYRTSSSVRRSPRRSTTRAERSCSPFLEDDSAPGHFRQAALVEQALRLGTVLALHPPAGVGQAMGKRSVCRQEQQSLRIDVQATDVDQALLPAAPARGRTPWDDRASDRAVRYPAGLFSATTIAAAGAESAKLAVILRPLRRTSSAPGSTDVPVAVTTRPLTCTSPAAIRSSLFRLDATPACARKRWSLTASPLLQRQLLLALAIGEQDLELVGTR